jgi:hypothetical protein
MLENYFEVLVLSSNITLTFNPITRAPLDFCQCKESMMIIQPIL